MTTHLPASPAGTAPSALIPPAAPSPVPSAMPSPVSPAAPTPASAAGPLPASTPSCDPVSARAAAYASAPAGGHWELLRALGAVADSPAAARGVGPALGLAPVSDADHTEAFVLNCPPYAAVFLGPEGGLGGEGAGRVGGFWRAISVPPPAEPDHLSALLALYARLGEAAACTARPASAAALARCQAALLAEHLWPWLPPYLDAIADLGMPALSGWAALTQRAIAAEFGAQPAAGLPLALRSAPAGLAGDGMLADLTAALTTPVRSGLVLTRRRLALGAGQAGVGHRIGERRFTLRAMLEQDPAATLGWLTAEARRWQARHAVRADATSQWWAARAARTAGMLGALAARSAAARGRGG